MNSTNYVIDGLAIRVVVVAAAAVVVGTRLSTIPGGTIVAGAM
jgi:hypothetical protein